MTEILLYKTANQDIKLEVLIQDETIWLNQKQMVELFGRDKSVISRHIKNIFNENELSENSVVVENATTATDKKIMYQKDWIEKLYGFLTLSDRDILQDNGKITASLAKELAQNEFNKYNAIQDKLYLSDFDNIIKQLEDK